MSTGPFQRWFAAAQGGLGPVRVRPVVADAGADAVAGAVAGAAAGAAADATVGSEAPGALADGDARRAAGPGAREEAGAAAVDAASAARRASEGVTQQLTLLGPVPAHAASPVPDGAAPQPLQGDRALMREDAAVPTMPVVPTGGTAWRATGTAGHAAVEGAAPASPAAPALPPAPLLRARAEALPIGALPPRAQAAEREPRRAAQPVLAAPPARPAAAAAGAVTHEPAPATVVHVSIGRVELVAAPAPSPARPRGASRSAPSVPLAEYLRGGSRGPAR
jgi:hypothetical protein